MVDELNDFKGGMAENYVHVQLAINGCQTYYWESERGPAIDFVIQRDGQLIPIEVKSADNTKAKSLTLYMKTYKPAYAIKLSAKNFGFEDRKRLFRFMRRFVCDIFLKIELFHAAPPVTFLYNKRKVTGGAMLN